MGKYEKFLEWVPLIGIYWVIKNDGKITHLFQMACCFIAGSFLKNFF